METKNLLNGEIGFEVKDIKDILAAKSLGNFNSIKVRLER